MKFNVNHEFIYLSKFDCGKTQNVEVKVGRKTLMCDFEKNMDSAHIDVYEKKSENRGDYSKYEAALKSIRIKNDAVLRKDFFEHVDEIAKAQAIISKYSSIVA